ncbi:MAG TPA: hypothetical protein VFY04_07035 [Solirubrobacterales bacterium]|nr:hypothetical protein [Solirubrobacterales bacterium]
MPLDGLRAWIGEVERKLGMRTRVFLVLAALAIGGAGAAIYIALDTRDTAVSESDVRALQEDLEAQIAGGGGAGATDTAEVTQLQAELSALKGEVQRLRGKGASAKPGGVEGNGSAEAETGGLEP